MLTTRGLSWGSLAAALALMGLPSAGCSEDTTGGASVIAQPGSDLDIGGAADTRPTPDTRPGQDAASADTAGGIDAEDAGGPAPGEVGAGCDDHDDCFSGWCVLGPDGDVCSKTCEADCPTGWECRAVSGPAGEPAFVCMHPLTTLCQPCTTNADCNRLVSNVPNLCLAGPDSDGGRYCGVTCSPDDDPSCPDGFTCAATTLGDDTTRHQCVLTAPDARCVCNGAGVALSMATPCTLTNEHGACPAQRTCRAADEPPTCEGEPPRVEVCNVIDDDCNGVVDDALLGETCATSNEHGTCTGALVCAGGETICDARIPGPESCNGLDDDCDGAPDQGFDDLDGDGEADCVDLDDDGDGFLDALDCAPLDPSVHPGAAEVCNGADDDCDQAADEDDALGCDRYFADVDGDGFGSAVAQVRCLCTPDAAAFYTIPDDGGPGAGTDCDDLSGDVFPGGLEVCNGVDDDCDGDADEELEDVVVPCAVTNEHGSCAGVQPCTPGVARCDAATPRPDVCNGLDDDCDGVIDDGAVNTDGDADADCVDTDDDNDGHPDDVDCAPLDASRFPGADETCDAADDDCNGVVDDPGALGCVDYRLDLDRDGYGAAEAEARCLCAPDTKGLYDAPAAPGAPLDCDDSDPGVHPAAAEVCDLVDQDCDGAVDDGVASPCGGCQPVCFIETGAGTDEPFVVDDSGRSSGVVEDPGGGVTLDSESLTMHTIWIANSAESTVSKLDTDTGCELGRYWSCANPSRTAVDLGGNGIIACRNDGRVQKVSVAEVDCLDRNGNGVVDTSRDANGDCVIDVSEMVANDECILWDAQPDGAGPSGCADPIGCARAAGVDGDNHVWVGMWSSMRLFQLDSATGVTLNEVQMSVRPYGLAIDPDGILWVASRAPANIAKVSPIAGELGTWAHPQGQVYGIALDPLGKVWVASGEGAGIASFDPVGETWTSYGPFGLGNMRGVAVRVQRATDGTVTEATVFGGAHAWQDACAGGTHRSVAVIDALTGTQRPTIDLGADHGPVGVAIDSGGFLWTVNQCTSSASKIDPATGVTVGNYPVGAGPYTYSDMTGNALRTITTSQGYYRKVFQGWEGSATFWDLVVVDADTPGDGLTWLELRYRTASAFGDLSAQPWVGSIGPFPTMTFPFALGEEGDFLEIEITLRTEQPGLLPVLRSIGVTAFQM